MPRDDMLPHKINLVVDTENLQRFCQKLIKRSRDIAKTHDALVTLESFITLFGKAAQGTKEYQQLELMIQSFTEQDPPAITPRARRTTVARIKTARCCGRHCHLYTAIA